MQLVFVPRHVWPGERTKYPKRHPFRSTWAATRRKLATEISYLAGTGALVRIGLAVTEDEIYKDQTGLKASVKPADDGVVLSFTTKAHGPLSYSADRYAGHSGLPGWQANVRAIALSLEALRMVDRHGCMHGRQYEGFRELPAESEAIELDPAQVVAGLVGISADEIRRNWSSVNCRRGWSRSALRAAHPDAGGTHGGFITVQKAIAQLDARYAH